jgi:CRP/FNR family transcriptional regulator
MNAWGGFVRANNLHRAMPPFRALYTMQAGMAKTMAVDVTGRKQVLAFHLPGETIGMDAMERKVHENAVVALSRTQFCCFPFAAIRHLAVQQPEAHLVQSAHHAPAVEQRQHHGEGALRCVSLIDLRDCRALLGLSTDFPPLPMSRADIGNHLRLTTESVSRLLGRLRQRHWVRVDRLGLHLLDLPALREQGLSLLTR